MLQPGETFFTRIGCMDGRVQVPLRIYGQRKFGAMYPDTITEAGKVGILANGSTDVFLTELKKEIDISLNIHHSRGILVYGHAECAGNPVDDDKHKDDIRKSVDLIKTLVNASVPVVGVFVKRNAQDPMKWEVEEIPQTVVV